MPVGAGISIAAGSVGSALIGSSAASSAADKQAQAAQSALALQQQAAAKLNPWINTGTGANYTLAQMYGLPGADGTVKAPDFSQFTNSPDYAFAKEQGDLGLSRAENARGMNLSGGALKDISQFNQGLATQQLGNYFQRLMQLSTLGQNAASAGVSAANSAAQTQMGVGASLRYCRKFKRADWRHQFRDHKFAALQCG